MDADIRISELTSPKIILSLFSRSIHFRQCSNLYNVSMGSFGGLYHVVIRNGLILFSIISNVKISIFTVIKIRSKAIIYCISDEEANTTTRSITVLGNPFMHSHFLEMDYS
jgi:hypothetical protein